MIKDLWINSSQYKIIEHYVSMMNANTMHIFLFFPIYQFSCKIVLKHSSCFSTSVVCQMKISIHFYELDL